MLADASSWYGTVSSQYDLAGRRTRLTWRDGFFVAYDHLVTGETVAIRENGATSGVGVLATFGYDDLGRRTSLVRGNGIATYYGYDAVSRLDLVDHEMPGVGNDAWLTMRYNPASQIVERGGAFGWYEWTGHGSGSTGSTANGLNQITARGGAPIAWDAKGNLASDGTRSFAYTAENRLASGAGSIQYYDPLGRLFYVSGGANLNFHFDGSAIVEESDAVSGSYRRRYVHGPGADEPLVWYEGSARRWLIADERGSIMGAFDDSGAGIGWAAYDEYGQTQETGNIGRFGYTGQARLPELGLYYYKARMYDPKLGFLQPDPIGYGGGMNPYAYAGGDPVNRTDPSGTEICTGSHINLPGESCQGGLAVGFSGSSTGGMRAGHGEGGGGGGKKDISKDPNKLAPKSDVAAQAVSNQEKREALRSCNTSSPDYSCGMFRDMSPQAYATMVALYRDQDVRKVLSEQIRTALGEQHETGIWLKQIGGDFAILDIRGGGLNWSWFNPIPRGGDIFVHIHLLSVKDGAFPGLSTDKDLPLAAQHGVMIVAYNVQQQAYWWVDYRR